MSKWIMFLVMLAPNAAPAQPPPDKPAPMMRDPDSLTPTGALGWGAVATVGGGLVVGAGMYLTSLLTGGKRMIDRIDELNTRQWKLQDELTACKTELGQCKSEHSTAKVENVQLKADLERMQLRMAALETATGTMPSSVNTPGVIVTDKDGCIMVFSPSLTMWVGWTPDEMTGERLDKLIPPDTVEEYRAAFGIGVPGAVLDPTKKLFSYLLDKTGKRVPVTVTVKKWPGADGNITATFQQRPSSVTLPPGTPQRRASDV